jgi:Tfp pilus assembly pilus retraction ATPase PilT
MMQAGTKFGMQTMNQSLLQSIRRRFLSKEAALERSSDPNELEQMFGRALAGTAARR